MLSYVALILSVLSVICQGNISLGVKYELVSRAIIRWSEGDFFMAYERERTVPVTGRPVEVTIDRGDEPELRVAPERREHLADVLACFDYLLEQSALAPEDRDLENVVLAVVDPIADVFQDGTKAKQNREGGIEVNGTGVPAEVNGGGGLNLVAGLSSFAREVHVVTRVGDSGLKPGVTQGILDSFPPHVKHDGVITQPGAIDSIKIRWKFGPTAKEQVAYREDAPPMDEATTAAMQQAIVGIVEQNPSIGKVGISEYGRNAINPQVIETLNNQITSGRLQPKVTIYDPRADRREHYDMFNVPGAILAPNREETAKLAQMDIPPELTGDDLTAVAHEAAQHVFERFDQIGGLLATYDRDGAFLILPDGTSMHMLASIQQQEFVNSSGGGDTVDATFLLLPERFPLEARVHAAMYTGGLAVAHKDTATLSPEMVREARARVATDLAFQRGYKFSTERYNKGFLPQVSAPVIAAELGRPDLEEDILAILQSPEAPLYDDAEPFTRQIVAGGDHFAFYTQGEGLPAIEADTLLETDSGYQMRKVLATGIPDMLGDAWDDSARERKLPKVIGGLDKRQSLEALDHDFAGVSQVVFVDDKLENVSGATDTLAARGVPAFGILVDRKGKYRREREQLPDHIIAVDALSQIPVDVVSSGDKRTAWFVDLDETSIDHDETKAGLRRRIWRRSMEDRQEAHYANTGAE